MQPPPAHSLLNLLGLRRVQRRSRDRVLRHRLQGGHILGSLPPPAPTLRQRQLRAAPAGLRAGVAAVAGAGRRRGRPAARRPLRELLRAHDGALPLLLLRLLLHQVCLLLLELPLLHGAQLRLLGLRLLLLGLRLRLRLRLLLLEGGDLVELLHLLLLLLLLLLLGVLVVLRLLVGLRLLVLLILLLLRGRRRRRPLACSQLLRAHDAALLRLRGLLLLLLQGVRERSWHQGRGCGHQLVAAAGGGPRHLRPHDPGRRWRVPIGVRLLGERHGQEVSAQATRQRRACRPRSRCGALLHYRATSSPGRPAAAYRLRSRETSLVDGTVPAVHGSQLHAVAELGWLGAAPGNPT